MPVLNKELISELLGPVFLPVRVVNDDAHFGKGGVTLDLVHELLEAGEETEGDRGNGDASSAGREGRDADGGEFLLCAFLEQVVS